LGLVNTRPPGQAWAEGEGEMNEDNGRNEYQAELERRRANSELPPAIALKRNKILRWNGQAPAPQVTHWTKRGVFAVRAFTPGKVTEIRFDDRHLGFGDNDPQTAAHYLFRGSYDAELGFAASECVPAAQDWNDLGG
jgi:hypothetical protein